MAGMSWWGNMNTEWMIGLFHGKKLLVELDKEALAESIRIAGEIFQ
jgi:hypothetical protein